MDILLRSWHFDLAISELAEADEVKLPNAHIFILQQVSQLVRRAPSAWERLVGLSEAKVLRYPGASL